MGKRIAFFIFFVSFSLVFIFAVLYFLGSVIAAFTGAKDLGLKLVGTHAMTFFEQTVPAIAVGCFAAGSRAVRRKTTLRAIAITLSLSAVWAFTLAPSPWLEAALFRNPNPPVLDVIRLCIAAFIHVSFMILSGLLAARPLKSLHSKADGSSPWPIKVFPIVIFAYLLSLSQNMILLRSLLGISALPPQFGAGPTWSSLISYTTIIGFISFLVSVKGYRAGRIVYLFAVGFNVFIVLFAMALVYLLDAATPMGLVETLDRHFFTQYAIQALGIYLLYRPDSNRWFASAGAPATV